MARNIIFIIAVVFLAVCVASSVSVASTGSFPADTAAVTSDDKPARNQFNKDPGDALRKLGRGASNCLTFPLEVPYQISKVNNNDGPMAAFTYGLVKGLTMSAFRALVGAYEVLTFPIPLPEFYEPILTNPEFMLEDWNY